MKIEVNHEACIGCGICRSIDTENFDFKGNGYIEAINQNVTDLTIEAKNSCPVDAINIIEEKTLND